MRLPTGRSILALWLLTCTLCIGVLAQGHAHHHPEPMANDSSKEPFEFTDVLEESGNTNSSAVISRPEPEPASVEPKTEPHPHPEPEPAPHPEPEPVHKSGSSSLPPSSEVPVPEPEPAIKFDNIQSEDYGDVVELVSYSRTCFHTRML